MGLMRALVVGTVCLWALVGCGNDGALGSSVCVPGGTRECLGPAGCLGGQKCLQDGAAWSACDCGEGTEGTMADPAAGGDESSDCREGPGNACWALWVQSPEAMAVWAPEPSLDQVGVEAWSAEDGAAGMMARVNLGTPVDLRRFDVLWFDGEIPLGAEADVSLSGPLGGCNWRIVGQGRARYTIDLTSPARGCWPTACGFERQVVEAVTFQTIHWGDFSLSMTVTDFGFDASQVDVSPTSSVGSAATGINDWCWSLFVYSGTGTGASVSWVTDVGPNLAHAAFVDQSYEASAGISVNLPEGHQDLTGATAIEFNATVQLGPPSALDEPKTFGVTLYDANYAWCGYVLDAEESTATYQVHLAMREGCGKGAGYEFDISNVRELHIASTWNAALDGEIMITSLDIL